MRTGFASLRACSTRRAICTQLPSGHGSIIRPCQCFQNLLASASSFGARTGYISVYLMSLMLTDILPLYLEGPGEIDMLHQTDEYRVSVPRKLMVEICRQLCQVQGTFRICSTVTNKTHHHYISIYPSLVTCHTVDGSHSCPALRPLQPDAVDRDCQPSEDATHYRLHLRGRDVLTTPPKRVSSSILRGVIQIDPY